MICMIINRVIVSATICIIGYFIIPMLAGANHITGLIACLSIVVGIVIILGTVDYVRKQIQQKPVRRYL